MKPNINNVSLAVCAGLAAQFPKDTKPQVAISGRSNVGKSSLINTLLGRKSLARMSTKPGKTITVNFYDVDNRFFIVDLPGYGYAKRSPSERERLLLLGDGYFRMYDPKLVVQLIDMKVGPTDDDLMMLNWLNSCNVPYTIAATKSDKLNKTERASAADRIPVDRKKILPFSSQTGEGKEMLWKIILHHINN